MYCTICNPHSHWPDWISATEHMKRDHLVRVICAWCKKILGTKMMTQPGDTHGICDECLIREEKQDGETSTLVGVERELVARS